MSANIVDLCQGIADALNAADAGTFSESFSATFEYNPNYSNIDAKTLRVVVTDAGGEIEAISRANLGFTDTARIVVLWRVDSGATGIDTDKMKRALLLLEEIALFLLLKPIANYSAVGTMERGTTEKDKSHYMPGNLEERLFAASLKIPYQTRVNLRTAFSS